jgi:hypothetical protein
MHAFASDSGAGKCTRGPGIVFEFSGVIYTLPRSQAYRLYRYGGFTAGSYILPALVIIHQHRHAVVQTAILEDTPIFLWQTSSGRPQGVLVEHAFAPTLRWPRQSMFAA